MQKKQMLFKTKGMNQDLSVSSFNPEFSFENINLRLSTNEGNTLMSWVNEKGTGEITLYKIEDEMTVPTTLEGVTIGTAVINHRLMVFTTKKGSFHSNEYIDYIYVIEKTDSNNPVYHCTEIFRGNLNFRTDNPLETLVSYEADNIQKVYWTDNFNQPRVANIAALLVNPVDSNTGEIYTRFDFITAAGLDSTITVQKRLSGGMFAPGVIQYCYTYFNKYGQQSNIVNVSPLYYLTHSDRGANAEDKVSNSFEITISSPDSNFDMVRLYSIQRTSIDAVPYIRAIEDFPATGTITYVDTGTSGAVVDPTELLFIGGKEITALTMEEKDQTLFLGNITQKNDDLSAIQSYFDNKRREEPSPIDLHFVSSGSGVKDYDLNNSDGILYSNTFTLNKNRRSITTFKGGDWYRFGFQLQKYTGEWTEPIYLINRQNDIYPSTSLFNTHIQLSYAASSINLAGIPGITDTSDNISKFLKTYKRIRPLIVYPEIQDRVTLCQGVLNPTVFNVEDRKERIPYAQASWYFRPYTTAPVIEPGIDFSTISRGDVPSTGTKYYLLLLRISAKELSYYLESKKVDFETGGQQGDERYSYQAAVKLKTVMCKNKADDTEDTEFCDVLFFMNSDSTAYTSYSGDVWGNPEVDANKVKAMTRNNTDYPKYYDLPDDLIPGFGGLLEYQGNEDSCTFDFVLDSDAIAKSGGGTHVTYVASGYRITFYKDECNGSRIAFTHYESLVAQVDQEIGKAVKQIEIQGSVNKYDDVYSTTENPDTENSNNQFFVDQSIVTLNSPDLELDPAVTGYGTDGLKLRIVGMLPITSSASAHSITTSTAMLPIGYQTKEDSDGNIEAATTFGKGELDTNTYKVNKDLTAGMHLVSDYLWEDSWLGNNGSKAEKTADDPVQYLVFPWQASRSMTNDIRANTSACSVLKTKVESNILYSCNTRYFSSGDKENLDFGTIDTQFHLQENEYIENLQLPNQLSLGGSKVNYYPNIDKSLINEQPWRTYIKGHRGIKNTYGATLMRYKSGTHAVVSLSTQNGEPKQDHWLTLLPFAAAYSAEGSNVGYATPPYGISPFYTFWGDEVDFFAQEGVNINGYVTDNGQPSKKHPYDFLWLGELYKDPDPNSIFGGDGPQALKANKWVVGGEAVELALNDNSITANLVWTEGDTYYQRYDCLKTYPFSNEDPNQLVEILSFMCETHVNLDGRYDRNRGQRDNTNVSPVNFNLMNPVYNQKDNFFTYKKTDDDKVSTYPNLITFTKTKEAGADIDAWTNITLSSNLELDGSRGEISSIQRLNNQLFAFQNSGIAQILYNESVQISSTEGVPIEIANSQKVQGKRYYSNSIGCSNKWSIANTPSGIYFIDSNDKGIYLFNGELNNLSNKLGFNTWCKTNIFSNRKWTPVGFEDFVTYYDRQNQEVLFINRNTALAFSEKLGAFTSFYSYGSAPYFCNLDDEGLWINKDNASNTGLYKLWKHRGGEYCSFFGEDNKPYSMTLVGNPEPLTDKLFTNLEFRACVEGDGEDVNSRYLPYLPFDSLETWNEYQSGITCLKGRNGHNPYRHHDGNNSTLLRKFRIWRCDIPRDNDTTGNRTAHPMDRMRNPWLYLKLSKEEDTGKKTEIHDVVMTYFE